MTAQATKGVCAITGASGYVGSRIAAALALNGWTTLALGRRPSDVPFSLDGGVEPGALRSRRVRALVHCAYDFTPRAWPRIEKVNVAGTRRLFDQAQAESVNRIVYISSTAAFEGCRSMYGRAKLATEEVAFAHGAAVVRPGLVFGSKPGGMLGTLLGILRRSPLMPLIGSGRNPMYMAHEDDLAALIARLLDEPPDSASLAGGPIIAAGETPIAFRTMLEEIASREGRRVVMAPVPWPLVWLGAKGLELVQRHPPLRSDSVVSFVNADPHPDFTRTRRTGVSFRAFSA